jgi:hypothetical protein
VPPRLSGSIRATSTRRPTIRPPVPIGPYSALCPVKASKSMASASISIGYAPPVCATSTRSSRSRRRQMLPASATGSSVPTTFEAWLRATIVVWGRMAATKPAGSRNPSAAQGTHHRVVLHAAGDDMIAGPQQAVQRQVERLGDVVSKDDAQRIGRVKQLGHRQASAIDDARRFHREPVPGSARVRAYLLQKMDHRLGHAGRLGPGRGGVVKIDHSLCHKIRRDLKRPPPAHASSGPGRGTPKSGLTESVCTAPRRVQAGSRAPTGAPTCTSGQTVNQHADLLVLSLLPTIMRHKSTAS